MGSAQYCGEKSILHSLKKDYQYPQLLLSSFPVIHLGNPRDSLLSFVSIIAGVGGQDNNTAWRVKGLTPQRHKLQWHLWSLLIQFWSSVLLSNSRRVTDCCLLLAELKDQLARPRDWKLAPGDSVTWNLKISGNSMWKMVKLRRRNTKMQLAKIGKTNGSCKSF